MDLSMDLSMRRNNAMAEEDDKELGNTLKGILEGITKLITAHDERLAAHETKDKDNAPNNDDSRDNERKPERKPGGFLARILTK
jgi:hypothetical protein